MLAAEKDWLESFSYFVQSFPSQSIWLFYDLNSFSCEKEYCIRRET